MLQLTFLCWASWGGGQNNEENWRPSIHLSEEELAITKLSVLSITKNQQQFFSSSHYQSRSIYHHLTSPRITPWIPQNFSIKKNYLSLLVSVFPPLTQYASTQCLAIQTNTWIYCSARTWLKMACWLRVDNQIFKENSKQKQNNAPKKIIIFWKGNLP
jgi:hypothetical protein